MPLKAHALELLLEENRGESGTIGYVDIDRVFKEYSGTTGARDEFMSEIKKKEDALNAKKTPVFTLKAEISKLKQEREFALTLPSLMETQRSVKEAADATVAAEEALKAAAAALVSTQTVAASTQTAAASTQTAAASTRTAQAPGIQTSTAPSPAPPAAAQISTASVPVTALPGMGGIDMPGITKVPLTHFKFSVSTSVPEIDAAISKKEAELAAKEEELRLFQKQTEHELLEFESRKSEVLLGRIYVALKELAVKEEVSVVVDKRNILYGQHAVDLTDKLLKKLETNGI